jgi:hypothetical protein
MYEDKHCMIDLETLGINPNAPIIQIGIVYFTLDGIYLSSQINVDFEDALKHGKADGSTIKWWLQQSKEAQDSLAKNERTAADACEIMERLFFGQNANHYWSHASFDFPILSSLFRSLNRSQPIQYKMMRDIRTLQALVPNMRWSERKTTHHNALADATYQAENVIKMLKALKGE